MGKNKIIVAIDVDSTEKAVAMVMSLQGEVGAFKVGLELVNAAGLGVIEALRAAGAEKVFYDCKFHDIPNTVAGASRAASKLGVWMFNVHCVGGFAMMKAAREAADAAANEANTVRPRVIGVTLLTSIDARTLQSQLGVQMNPADYVLQMARMAAEAGLDGVVASPHEIEVIREACGPDFMIVTPGVRPIGAEIGDQKRVMTPKVAADKGADYLVIGRPITASPDPRIAAQAIAAELDSAD